MDVFRNVRVLVISGAALLGPVWLSAAEATPHASTAATTANSATATRARQHLTGNIVSFDAKSNVLTVSLASGTAAVTLDPVTTIKLDGKPAARSALIAGRHAYVTTKERDGAKHAVVVAIRS